LPRAGKTVRMKPMGRKRTRVDISVTETADIHRRLRSTTHPRDAERLRTLLDATSGRHTLEDLARRAGRARATVQLWLGKFELGGLNELLKRETPPGSVSPLGAPRLQAQLRAGIQEGRWHSAEEMAVWLNEAHGIRRAKKSMYYWLEKNGWRAPGARTPVRSSAAKIPSVGRSRTSRVA
jgi:transposase